MPPHELDHLVVAARTLEEGAAWCAQMFGVEPAAGGRHDFMGTHNRVFSIASALHPRAYLEIIAIDTSVPAPGRARWFDLDDARLQKRLAESPLLVHWVARVADIDAVRAEMSAGGIDVGRVVDAARGALRWRITVRDDGRRPLDGAAPALIQWHGPHPTDALPSCGISLVSLTSAPHPLRAVLDGPRGRVTLESDHCIETSTAHHPSCSSPTR